jgi:hypothetical protein
MKDLKFEEMVELIDDLVETVNHMVSAIETILINLDTGHEPDWFDAILMKQELERGKKMLNRTKWTT